MKIRNIVLVLFACLFAGCGQKEALQETTPTQETVPTLTQAVTQTNEKKIIPIIQQSKAIVKKICHTLINI